MTVAAPFLPPASRRTPRIVLIGIDGLRWQLAAASPRARTLRALAAEGEYRRMVMATPTLSGPGWSSLLTGTTHAVHGVVDNTFVGSRLAENPDVLSQAFFQDMRTRTFAAAGWPALVNPDGMGPVIHPRLDQQKAGLHRVIARDGETHGFVGVDAEVADFALEALRSEHACPDVSFVYFCDVDDTGHLHGAVSDQYQSAIERVDAHVARLQEAVRRRAAASGEEWLLVLVADHGHVDAGGHGGGSIEERESFVIRWSTAGTPSDWPEAVLPNEVANLILAERARGR